MRILVVGANGKTGRHVIAALKARPERPVIRGFSRSAVLADGVEKMQGDLDTPADRARAVAGMDAVIHYGPAFDPRETSMGTGMIDATVAAGVRRFIYISVIHPEIDDLMNHQAKLAVESYLLDTNLDWTILRPQHYMQNIDARAAVGSGQLHVPTSAVVGHVNMADLAEAVAKVALEPGHSYATYDISSNEHLSLDDICAVLSRVSGKRVRGGVIPTDKLVEMMSAHHPLPAYTVEAAYRLFGYYSRRGLRGNPNTLTWLLGRQPTSFEQYVARCLAQDQS